MQNPCGGVKDRLGKALIEDAERRGVLRPDMTIVDVAFECTRRLGRKEGIVAGVSSGAALHAALSIASRAGGAEKFIVVLLPDKGERYMTSALLA